MYRPNLTLVAGACVAAAIGTVAIAASHTVPPSVKGRQGAMQVISLHAGLLGEMARGNSDYDAGVAQTAADNLVTVSNLNLSTLFPEGTDNGVLSDTIALPAIWSDPAGFQTAWEGFGTAAANLQAVAGDGLDPMRAAMGDLGKSCGACHDTYRAKN
tara:strand:+ start:870 stop:1340 length:471 start_codon:yes stop_codon:yes gene_type:complete